MRIWKKSGLGSKINFKKRRKKSVKILVSLFSYFEDNHLDLKTQKTSMPNIIA